jgi:hypothetical protein
MLGRKPERGGPDIACKVVFGLSIRRDSVAERLSHENSTSGALGKVTFAQLNSCPRSCDPSMLLALLPALFYSLCIQTR